MGAFSWLQQSFELAYFKDISKEMFKISHLFFFSWAIPGVAHCSQNSTKSAGAFSCFSQCFFTLSEYCTFKNCSSQHRAIIKIPHQQRFYIYIRGHGHIEQVTFEVKEAITITGQIDDCGSDPLMSVIVFTMFLAANRQ